MHLDRDVDYLKQHRSLHLPNLLPPARCREMITRYNDALTKGNGNEGRTSVENELIDECRALVFTDELDTLLSEYFHSPVKQCWSSFDVDGCAGAPHNPNALWHLDGGVRGTHKLFINLNPVAEHGGNTVMVDRDHTNKLMQAGALTVEADKRKEDLSGFFAELGIIPEIRAYDLQAGDGLLFDPLTLAHRCQPTMAGKWRYTICFTVVPMS